MTSWETMRVKSLQEWFLYVAAFPEDEEIEFTDLRKCWMEVGSELSPTAIVNELERRCLVKINKSWDDDDRIIVHDMLRKLCIRILKGKYGSQQEHEKGCLFGYDWTIGIRDATFAEVSFISKNVGSFLSDNHVRDVLLLDKCEGLSNVDDSFINHIQGVKVLSLWRCSKMRFIPESISKLKNLQVLDIQGTEVSELPDALFSLTSLKYLKCTTRWMPMKCNIALLPQLSDLEELGLNVSSKEDSSVLDLTGISRFNSFTSVEDSENSDDSFEWLPHRLETLDIDCGGIHLFNLDGSFTLLRDLGLTNLHIGQSEFKDDLAASLPNLEWLFFNLAPDIEWEHLPLFVTQLAS
ncbi:uncharacterized protein LOC112347686 [Selaginella moellendorffii]|uniref:uncharacterized protein LOC112347686 n=1 Tax=Selaginella moellendorffii TaxID=88036 RepID=UPI000D1D0A6E|nr:uncharacterized protein LOC112347686 [Selaginella moellendorffii]|eukprot:XP_024534774.1 uncharacterized protein LOC112347686 [Selaginella moellendorffii]